MLTIRLSVLTGIDALHNLVLEQSLFEQLPENEVHLLLWRNQPCVVIGRAQNPWLEANLAYLEAHHIPLFRRISGGGTVYHDEANLNFTLMAPKPFYHKDLMCPIIVSALNRFGIKAELSARNDILYTEAGQTYKLSGSAYRETRLKGLHHGTLLINSDLTQLRAALKVSKPHLISQGVASQRAKVINLSSLNPAINMDSFQATLIEELAKAFAMHGKWLGMQYGDGHLPESATHLYEQQQSWAWNYGKTPKFRHYINGAHEPHEQDAYCEINQAHITQVVAPQASPNMCNWLQSRLSGVCYDQNSLEKALTPSAQDSPTQAAQLRQWRRLWA